MRSFSLVFFMLIFCAGTALAKDDAPGSISGTVNYCGLGGLDGMQVYIPGKMYTVITDESGTFQFDGLVPGSYTVSYRSGDKLLNKNLGIRVLAGQATALGVIAFCDRKGAVTSGSAAPAAQMPAVMPAANTACTADSTDPQCADADADGVVAARDCDDHNAKVHPGAIELCDGVDNNCDGLVDENVSVLVMHGMGSCQNGQVLVQSCSDGFSDCDGDASNGCEVDINNDVEHCGACDEECTPTEICVAGGCE